MWKIIIFFLQREKVKRERPFSKSKTRYRNVLGIWFFSTMAPLWSSEMKFCSKSFGNFCSFENSLFSVNFRFTNLPSSSESLPEDPSDSRSSLTDASHWSANLEWASKLQSSGSSGRFELTGFASVRQVSVEALNPNIRSQFLCWGPVLADRMSRMALGSACSTGSVVWSAAV